MSIESNIIGHQAPLFRVEAIVNSKSNEIESSSFDLKELIDQNVWIVILFSPLSSSNVSKSEITDISEKYQDFETLNTKIIAITCDSIESLISLCNHSIKDGGIGRVNIPLVSDHNQEICKSYGVSLYSNVCERTTVVIDPDGVVRHISADHTPIGRSVKDIILLITGCNENYINGYKENQIQLEESNQIAKKISIKYIDTLIIQISNILKLLLSNYRSLLTSHPLLTKSISSAIISAFGEIIGSYIKYRKVYVKSNNETRKLIKFYDFIIAKRVVMFSIYGFALTGPIFHYWYGFLDKLVNRRNLPNYQKIIQKLAINQLVLTPPFLLLTLVYLQYFQSLNSTETIARVKNSFAIALYMNWKVWTPAQAVNFAVVPIDYRVLYGNLVALWWNIYLSIIS